LVDARGFARRAKGENWLKKLLLSGCFAKEEEKSRKIFRSIVSNASNPLVFLSPGDLDTAQEQLVNIFKTTHLLLNSAALSAHGGVALAADLALDGYLPIDLVGNDSAATQVLIY
jgi:hypothetical protein